MRIVMVLLLLSFTSQIHSQWTEINGPYGGQVKTFTYNGLTGQHYIGMGGDGVYSSTNDGNHWFKINNGLPGENNIINKIKIFKNNLFVGTYGGLYKSTNNGNNWYLFGLSGKTIFSIAFKDSMTFAGGQDSLYYSNNNGQTWISFAGHGANNPIYDILIIDTIVYIGTEFQGVFRSLDWGLNWTQINIGLTNYKIRSLEFKDSVLYCGTFGKGVFQSIDFGASWNKIGTNFNKYITSMAFVNGNHYVSTYNEGGFQRSINDSNWSNTLFSVLYPKKNYNIQIVNNYRYVSTETGIFKSHVQNFGWIDINNGIKNFEVNDVRIDSLRWMICTNRGFFVSTDNGNNWEQKNKGLPAANLYLKVLYYHGGLIYAGTWGEGLYSTDSTYNWSKITSPITYINKIVKNDSLLVLATELQGVYTWDYTNWITRNNGLGDLHVRSILLTPIGWFAGTASNGVFKSTDQGHNWFEQNDSLADKRVNCITQTDSFLFVGTEGGGVFCFSENENRWYNRSSGIGNNKIYSLYFMNGTLIAGTYSGLYYSDNNGLLWKNINTGISGKVFAITDYHDSLIVGTNKGYLYSASLSDIVISVKNNSHKPTSYLLEQNYPNPFNPNTVISYVLAKNNHVSLKIYNILGQEVRTLVNQPQALGKYSVVWDGKDNQGKSVSSGIYLYRIQTNDFVQSKKMILVK